jgi:phage-related protein
MVNSAKRRAKSNPGRGCNRIARIPLSVQQGRLIVLHGFIKKSQKIPDEDLALARKRKREFDRRG